MHAPLVALGHRAHVLLPILDIRSLRPSAIAWLLWTRSRPGWSARENQVEVLMMTLRLFHILIDILKGPLTFLGLNICPDAIEQANRAYIDSWPRSAPRPACV